MHVMSIRYCSFDDLVCLLSLLERLGEKSMLYISVYVLTYCDYLLFNGHRRVIL